jgi:hypothetical protein
MTIEKTFGKLSYQLFDPAQLAFRRPGGGLRLQHFGRPTRESGDGAAREGARASTFA